MLEQYLYGSVSICFYPRPLSCSQGYVAQLQDAFALIFRYGATYQNKAYGSCGTY